MNQVYHNGPQQPGKAQGAPSANPVTQQQMLQQLAQRVNMLQHMQPQQFLAQYFPQVPQNTWQSPEQVTQYMLQNGMITPDQIANAQQLQHMLGL